MSEIKGINIQDDDCEEIRILFDIIIQRYKKGILRCETIYRDNKKIVETEFNEKGVLISNKKLLKGE